jgi:hypothetical protein
VVVVEKSRKSKNPKNINKMKRKKFEKSIFMFSVAVNFFSWARKGPTDTVKGLQELEKAGWGGGGVV